MAYTRRKEVMEALVKQEGMSMGICSIAMSLVLGKSYQEMVAFYGKGTLASGLQELKHANIVKNVGWAKWELNYNIKEWTALGLPRKEREASQPDNVVVLQEIKDLQEKIKSLEKKVV